MGEDLRDMPTVGLRPSWSCSGLSPHWKRQSRPGGRVEMECPPLPACSLLGRCRVASSLLGVSALNKKW